MTDVLHRLQRRLARDDAVSEVVAYVLMFGMGAIALTFSMEILTDAQQRGSEVVAGRQMNQIAQVASTLVEEAARAAHHAPNATFTSTFELPSQVGGHNYTVLLFVPNEANWDPPPWRPNPDCPKNPKLRVVTTDEQLNTEIRLSNRTTGEIATDLCLRLNTDSQVDSSDPHLRVVYERDDNPPEIRIESVNR